jgi:hypothetical protein
MLAITATRTSAMNQQIPAEVIELILGSLPTRDLLLAQRVCRLWRDIILASPVLQQKLFMQPVPAHHALIRTNPLLDSILPPSTVG